MQLAAGPDESIAFITAQEFTISLQGWRVQGTQSA
jgi:hypothetical protein